MMEAFIAFGFLVGFLFGYLVGASSGIIILKE